PPPAPEPAFVLSLRGVAPSQTAVSKLVLGLERTTLFRRVEMLESKRADPDPARPTQELVMFYIECRFATKAPTP
ncbi:MAG TPA: PilN domain-containing protein, partial [Phycisphaerales bacterium]|nr:PilN domain-containing protein [Phycisphaerales bacterium]